MNDLASKPLPGPFGVEVADVDVETLTDDLLRSLLMTLYERRVVVLRTGGLTKETYAAFGARCGNPIRLGTHDRDLPEIVVMTNIGKNSTVEKRGAAHWHSDQSFKEEVSSVTMLYSAQAPEHGGETRFCDLAAAYADLPNSTKREIDDLKVIHRHGVSVAARPGDHTPIPPKNWDQSTTVCHPLVRRHPVTNEQTLYAISGTSQGIEGMTPDRGERLLQELSDHASQDRYVSQHQHRCHDLVLWDNPTTMHSATPLAAATGSKDTREVHRISLRGYPSFFQTPN